MIPFIQRVTRRSSPFSRGSAARSSRRRAAAHAARPAARRRSSRRVDRARPATVAPAIRPPVAARCPATGAPQPHVDAARAQVRAPTGRSTPRWSGASSTRSARPPARVRSNSSWTQDQPAGARAHLPRARGDERARQPVGEEACRNAAERWSALDVVPPALQVPLPEAPLVAARQQREQPLHEERVLGRRGRRAASRPRTGSG